MIFHDSEKSWILKDAQYWRRFEHKINVFKPLKRAVWRRAPLQRRDTELSLKAVLEEAGLLLLAGNLVSS
jgi:hypothetical protein